MQHKTRLSDRSVLTISGAQASSFLQGLITNDMGQLEGQKAIYAALLTPQGKILFDFIVSRASDEGFHIDCATTQKSAILKRLNLYRLRAEVEITDSAIEVAAAWGEAYLPALPDDTTIFMDPRLPELGHRIIASRDVLNTHFGQDDGSYRAHQLMLGVPDSADLPPDTIFALDAGFEELSGVSFSKGCYVGQEVTSRMKHRTSARKRFFIVEANRQYPPGTPLEAAGREIGALSSQIGKFALAHLRMDRLAEAEQENVTITIADNEIIIRKPEWLDAPLAAS
jgi:folate-binding protein YgfZ